jgi:hypothetical protein
VEKEHHSLTKTCSICGELKPLSAFLHMSATSGTEYGAVCSDCRKKGADKPRIPESDETTQSSSGTVIDSKNKLEADITKREEREHVAEEYYEEREETNVEQQEEQNNIEYKITQEKQHRQTFLDRGMASGKKQTTPGESRWRVEQTAQQAGTEETANNLEKATKEELREKGVDQTSTEDLRHGAKEKHKGVAFRQGAAFQSFAASLGKSSTFSQSTPTNPAVSETIAESIEKNWGPGRKK